MFGLGLRHKHYLDVIQQEPKLDFLEIHTENFITNDGPHLNILREIAKIYPLSFHCVGLSIGSASPINKEHIKQIKKLVDEFNPFLISDHLSWSKSDNGTANDLLPIPYTKESLKIFCDNVKFIQDFLGRNILIENPSAYIEFNQSEIHEIDFLNSIVKHTNCQLLLDINNVFVSAENFNFDANKYIAEIDIDNVAEIHLAGHSIYQKDDIKIRIDTHNTHICQEVLELYQNFAKTTKNKIPTLVEWDADLPEFEILYQEVEKVKSLL